MRRRNSVPDGEVIPPPLDGALLLLVVGKVGRAANPMEAKISSSFLGAGGGKSVFFDDKVDGLPKLEMVMAGGAAALAEDDDAPPW